MSAPKPLCVPWLKGDEAKREEGLLHSAPCSPALVLLSLDPPHAIAGEDSSACFIKAALHKGCCWSFQRNIHELLFIFQCFGQALPSYNGQLGSSRYEEDMPRLHQLLGNQWSRPACLLPVPWGMAQNVVQQLLGFTCTSLNCFLFFSIYFSFLQGKRVYLPVRLWGNLFYRREGGALTGE